VAGATTGAPSAAHMTVEEGLPSRQNRPRAHPPEEWVARALEEGLEGKRGRSFGHRGSVWHRRRSALGQEGVAACSLRCSTCIGYRPVLT
jgi:hypothetical protein